MKGDGGLGTLLPDHSVTAPPRGFESQDWAALSRDARRQLVQAVGLEAGMAFRRAHGRAAFDDLVFEGTPIFGPRRVCLRVAHRDCTQADLENLSHRAEREDFGDYLLIGFGGDDPALREADHYLAADEMVELLEASAVVAWKAGTPAPDVPSLSDVLERRLQLAAEDTLGLQALAPLSRNKLPWAMRLSGISGSPDDWFERYFFRLATAGCGLTGLRFGSSQRGRAVADGILRHPDRNVAALYDCKASRDGYRMSADHQRRLLEYAVTPQLHDGESLSIQWVVVVSSGFASGGSRHPFHARARAFQEHGLRLAYIRASDIVAAATTLRPALDVDTSIAKRVDWCAPLATGLVARDGLLAVVAQALEAHS